ncbi:unnamed protein product [Heligmosomoides polygyrus]|uniref:Fungal_trans domain-containing protein n=1 Tax=Heligmosomoides polygyrus TaxID=6339 RepID=A0A183FWZ0_HELPZ|nr:unnamed protein product [Heligmosomoides polygyrus]
MLVESNLPKTSIRVSQGDTPEKEKSTLIYLWTRFKHCYKAVLFCAAMVTDADARRVKRFYVRPTHATSSHLRFRSFVSYLTSLDEAQFHEYRTLMPEEFADLIFPTGGNLDGECVVVYYILAYGGIAQTTWMQRPFAQPEVASDPVKAHFNESFSSARCIAESVFDTICSRLHIFQDMQVLYNLLVDGILWQRQLHGYAPLEKSFMNPTHGPTRDLKPSLSICGWCGVLYKMNSCEFLWPTLGTKHFVMTDTSPPPGPACRSIEVNTSIDMSTPWKHQEAA